MVKRKFSGLTGLSQFTFALNENASSPTTNSATEVQEILTVESSLTSAFDTTTQTPTASTSNPRHAISDPSRIPLPPSPGRTSITDGRANGRPAKKKRKTNTGAARALPDWEFEYPEGWVHKYGALNIPGVVHYTDASQVPQELKKYFHQRYRLLSLYSSSPGCLLDTEGWYSITPEAIANQIAERCRCDTILDAFCGVGGNAIAFAQTCERVIALDTSPTRLALARHNAQIYGVADRIEFILGDYISFAKSYLTLPPRQRTIDIVFLSPPWGGPSYLSGSPTKQPTTNPLESQVAADSGTPSGEYMLDAVKPIHGKELFQLTRGITKNVAYYLPRNTKLEEVGELLSASTSPKDGDDDSSSSSSSSDESSSSSSDSSDDEDTSPPSAKKNVAPAKMALMKQEQVEVEEEWMGNKLKALTCYFGGLVRGQEDMF